MRFDIEAQPLDQALMAFGTAVHQQIFYETSITKGRRSTEVKGIFEPRVALHILLWGSGLTVRVIALNTVSVVKPDSPEAEVRAERQMYFSYFGMLQTKILGALCSSQATRPGAYHIVLQYWISQVGRISRLKIVGSSKSATRDGAIMESLKRIAFPPPGAMPQPVTMVIQPTADSAPNNCAGALSAGRSR